MSWFFLRWNCDALILANNAKCKYMLGNHWVANKFWVLLSQVTLFDSYLLHLLWLDLNLHFMLRFENIYGVVVSLSMYKYPPITKQCHHIMSYNICRSTLYHTLNQSLFTKYDPLCALNCARYKPITKNWPHIIN
jgi:hypothetical protein